MTKKKKDLGWDSEYIKDLFEKQKDDLKRCWDTTHGSQPCIGIMDIDFAEKFVLGNGGKFVKNFNKHNVVQGFYWEKTDADPECWLDKNLSDKQYRAAFHRFLRKYHKLKDDCRLDRSVVVEHVLSAKRAQNNFELNYIRVTIADSYNNSLFGSQWESYFEKNERLKLDYDYTDGGTRNFGDAEPDYTNLPSVPIPGSGSVQKSSQMLLSITWPLATKAFNIHAPRGPINHSYVLSTSAELIGLGLMPSTELEQEYGLTHQNFMMGQAGIPHYDAQQRSTASFKLPCSDRILRETDTLREWLAHFPLTFETVLNTLQGPSWP